MRDGDGLVLDDGAIVLVAGEPEALVEIAAGSALDAVRLAWHLGNRHTDVQIVGDKLRIRRDHVLEEMLRGLGATVVPLEAPFDPESGAPHRARSWRVTEQAFVRIRPLPPDGLAVAGLSGRRVLLFQRHRMGGGGGRHQGCRQRCGAGSP